MPSIFDFSGAIPWVTQGFLLGLLAFWLFRRLFGGGSAHHAAQIADLNAQLDAANRKIGASNQNMDGQITKAKYYEGEYNTLLAANQALTQSAGDAPRLRAELEKLRADSVAVAAAVEDAYKKQINGLAAELNAKTGEASRLTADLSSTRSVLDKLRADSIAAATNLEKTYKDQIANLQSQLTSAGSASNGELQRLSGELTSTKSALEKLRADSSAAAASAEKAYKDQIGTMQSQLSSAANANSEVTRLGNDLTAAKADIDVWRKREIEWRGYEERYTTDIARLTNDLKAAHSSGGEATYLKGEVTRLTSELSNAKSGLLKDLQNAVEESNKHKSEAAHYAKALADAQSNHQALAMEHHTTKNDLNQVRSGLEETSLMVAQRHREIEDLKAKLASMPADIENYKRFKDALEAANRIASGKA
jgi:CAP-Gly domain-containing linker protein 1